MLGGEGSKSGGERMGGLLFELANGGEDEVRLGVFLVEVGGEREGGDVVVGDGGFSGRERSGSGTIGLEGKGVRVRTKEK